MIRHELCNGLELRICDSCARLASRYDDAVIAAHRTRVHPVSSDTRCADWLGLPHRALDPSHAKL